VRFPRGLRRLGAFPAALFLLGCGSGREVVVGAILSLSGEGAYYGQAIRQGMDLAVEQVNAAGGIQGNPLRVLYRDSASSPDDAEKAAVELYDRYDVPLIVGAVLSSETLRVAQIAERRHKILLSPASSSPEISRAGHYVFRVYPSDALEGMYMAQLAQSELALRRVAVVAIDNAFGRGLVSVFGQSFRGETPPRIFTYPQRGADYAGLVGQVEAWGPDGIYLVGYYDDVAAILREIRRRSLPARVLSTSGFAGPRVLQEAGEAAEGVIFPQTVFDPESQDPTVAGFVRDFRARYKTNPDLWAAHGYDAVRVTAEAIRRGEGPVPDRLARALLTIQNFPGASGTLSFNPEGDVVQYPRAFIVHHGRFVLFRDYLDEVKRNPEGHPPKPK